MESVFCAFLSWVEWIFDPSTWPIMVNLCSDFDKRTPNRNNFSAQIRRKVTWCGWIQWLIALFTGELYNPLWHFPDIIWNDGNTIKLNFARWLFFILKRNRSKYILYLCDLSEKKAFENMSYRICVRGTYINIGWKLFSKCKCHWKFNCLHIFLPKNHE